MNNVQFDDQNQMYTVQKKNGLTQMVVKMGLAKDEKGAQVVLLIVAVIAVVIALLFMFGGSGPGAVELPPPNADATL